MSNTKNTIGKDVADMVRKHGATRILRQLHMAADMVCSQEHLILPSLPLRRALEEATHASYELDQYLVHTPVSALGMIYATEILSDQERSK